MTKLNWYSLEGAINKAAAKCAMPPDGAEERGLEKEFQEIIGHAIEPVFAGKNKRIAQLEAQVGRNSRGDLDNLNRAAKAERELSEAKPRAAEFAELWGRLSNTGKLEHQLAIARRVLSEASDGFPIGYDAAQAVLKEMDDA